MSILGDNIRRLRKERKLTQNALAEYLSVGGSIINRYEKATSNPSIENIILLANLFNVSIDDLITNPDVKLNPLDSAPSVPSVSINSLSDSSKDASNKSILDILDSRYISKEEFTQLISRLTGKSKEKLTEMLKEIERKKGEDG